ncbi:radical SAM/SPASM domain-containing protein (plasmid) [Rhizobium etli bv. phaseoli str. IE4803]|nr:radical SAM/SPASM domain-containing protein [Rhizobium etli bv. phaseoli str. IE4803]
MLVPSKYLVVSSPIQDSAEIISKQIILSTRSLKSFLLPSAVCDSIRACRLEELPSELVGILEDAQIVVSDVENELESVLTVSREAIANDDVLYECIQPTSSCNLGCGYCGQLHGAQSLTQDVMDAIHNRIKRKMRQRNYRELRIGWFGGEPLASLSVIKSLTRRLQNLAAGFGAVYTAHIITNGLLLDIATARAMVNELSIDKIEVTLDGPAAAHDSRRMTKSGRPTFSRIVKNLRAVAEDENLIVKIRVRCNVDRENVDVVPELIDQLAELGLQRNISLYFAPIHNWENGADDRALAAHQFAALEIDWMARMWLRGFDLALLPAPKPVVCMAVDPNSELIDPFGEVYNCTEVSLTPAHGDPNIYAMGTLDSDRPSEAADDLAGFLDQIAQHRYGCSRCPMLPVCGGACPKVWKSGGVPCPSAKHNLKDRLVLAYAISKLQFTPETVHRQ